jgi:hypothetical protein
MEDVLEKVGEFRFRYAQMLQLHESLSSDQASTNINDMVELVRDAERAVNTETNSRVKGSLQSNLIILKKRLTRAKTIGVRIRELEAQLSLAKNSLGLLYDEVRSANSLGDNISAMADNLVANLEISESLRDELEEPDEVELKLPIKQSTPVAVRKPQIRVR